MNPFCRAGKDRAAFVCILAKRQDVIEILPGKLVDVLGAMATDINPDLVHDLNSLGADNTRLTSGALDVELDASVTPQQAFGHLASG